MTDTFPRQQARTRNFSLGVPRSFAISPDGQMIAFLRSRTGSDPVTCLWALDLPAGEQDQPDTASERLLVDPAAIGAARDEPDEERARRERSRERAGGVVAFATDSELTLAAFALAGEVYTVRLRPGAEGPEPTGSASPAIDPRPDPAGLRVAYVHEGALRLTDLLTGEDTELIGEPGGITYGLAEFVAAEEMGRMRGYWWAPDGSALLVARVDSSGVNRWHIADPANPARPATEVGYPAAGTPNARVELFIVRLDGTSVPVRWDAEAFPYLAVAQWDAGGPRIVVQSRDQRRMRLLAIDAESGGTRVIRDDADPHWVDIVPGVPDRLADGRIVWTAQDGDARRLLIATEQELADRTAAPVTPATLIVRSVLSADGDTVLLAASESDPAEISVWEYSPGGLRRISGDGVHAGLRAAGTTVLSSRSMAGTEMEVTVLRDRPGGPAAVASIGSAAERPVIGGPQVTLLRAGQRGLRTAVLLPSWYERGSGSLPVLMDPYGGPHAQRVVASGSAYLTSQWFADQGFAVVVADGRGTPGRGPAWDRAVAGNLADAVLEDQVDALAAAAELVSSQARLDLTRVGIRGWSVGGDLAALAVLRRPDVFHAAIAGAPVTDWRLYDTHYTERYLGSPEQTPAAYDHSSLITDAHKLTRPLMLIHGLADDNVVVAHTLRLSSALLAAGRPHCVLPLSGVTHMASQEEVAENMLLLQVDFLRTALGVASVTPADAAPRTAQ